MYNNKIRVLFFTTIHPFYTPKYMQQCLGSLGFDVKIWLAATSKAAKQQLQTRVPAKHLMCKY
jgi:hypothetical protein